MAKRKKTIDDPVFGKLTFDYLWGGMVPMGPLGEIEVLVDPGIDDSPPNDEQRAAVVRLQQQIPTLIDPLQEAIYKYYCDNRDMYVEMAIEPEEDTPELPSVKELKKILSSSPTLVVEAADEGEAPEVKLSWSVTFDLEHSLAVTLLDGVIQNVGIE